MLDLSDRWGITARELLARIDSRELSERIALENVRAREPDRDDVRTALICRELHRSSMAGNPNATLDDFLPKAPTLRRHRCTKAQLIAWAKCHGARERKPK